MIFPNNQLMKFTFTRVAMAASLTDSVLDIIETDATAGDHDVVDHEVPFGLSIVQVTSNISAAGTQGLLTIKPFINGTVVTPTALLMTVTTEVRKSSTRIRPQTPGARAAKPAAGGVNYLGCKITTSADWLADGSLDLAVTLWCMIEGIRF